MFNFFKKTIFGLNISDYSIKIISLEDPIKEPKLLAMGGEILEPGIIKSGKIIDKKRFEIILRSLVEGLKFGKTKTGKLIFTLPESKTFIHFFELPKALGREKMKKEIELQAINNFPFSLSELYFDSRVRNKGVLLAAIQKDIVEDYLEIFKKLKLWPIVLETESMSLARALIGESQNTILITDIGARTTNFSIFTENFLKLSISIDIAGDKFSQVLMEKLSIPFQEAENMKKEIGLDPEKKEGKVFLILQKEIQEITSEIKKIEEYFQNKSGKVIEKIILTGGSAALPYLTEYFTENLEKPISVGDPWNKINIDILKTKEYFKEAQKVNPILYTTAIGSALRGLMKNPKMIEINLLPKN
ncbi:MAG TPA: hypothetical protein ENI19_03100 [Candidatus Nealsonbacteria bacterium]|uniref:SHS2 domain-containing protein n=1 Tax=marine sediment metagenome TaxID=412755 RepID=A0A0F9XIQ4_9ZZZZ|nr:hypothetical protein [Candidatus Nealsonbacteria bacterium]HEB46667.1 hypothetical protein [Candidatus Nealsonbacteria bacterium]